MNALIALIDRVLALIGLILLSPMFVPVLFLVWLQDRHSPFYVAPRVGKDGKEFSMVKLRSMRVGADKSGVDSTSANDSRITPIGRIIRRYKLDELTQLWNVLIGDMSLVGPRPNVERETRDYTDEERVLLTVRPGITDYASIVFSDEGEILKGASDPDLRYNQLIRPWKSRLGLFYIGQRGILLNFKLIGLTAVAIVSRSKALSHVADDLTQRDAPLELVNIAQRNEPLMPASPPGSDQVIVSRNV